MHVLRRDHNKYEMAVTFEDEKCRVFQNELYNIESLYKFIQRTGTVFRTVVM
jgi:hypothetical protein